MYFFILIVAFNTEVFAAGQKKSGTVKKSFFKSLQINTEAAVSTEKETEKSKKAKDFSNADDRTTDEEEK